MNMFPDISSAVEFPFPKYLALAFHLRDGDGISVLASALPVKPQLLGVRGQRILVTADEAPGRFGVRHWWPLPLLFYVYLCVLCDAS